MKEDKRQFYVNYAPHKDENKLKKLWQKLNFNEMHFKYHYTTYFFTGAWQYYVMMTRAG